MKRIQNHLIGIALLAMLLAPPARILLKHYTANSGFLGLIYFGREYKESALPEVREISPVTSSPRGYDGQFYAQLALLPPWRTLISCARWTTQHTVRGA
jgi:hypothetical protein